MRMAGSCWQPDPPTPFEILVIDSAGSYSRPILIETLDPASELVVTHHADSQRVDHGIWVRAEHRVHSRSGDLEPVGARRLLFGSQPISCRPSRTWPASTRSLKDRPPYRRFAAWHADARMILIDGARVSSERRAGASATFLDPSLIEGVDVSRGPGSVAYGSDAFGGVISVRTRRVMPGSPWAFQFSGTVGTGMPERRGSIEIAKGLPAGGVLFAAHAARGRRLGERRRRSLQLRDSAIAGSCCAPSRRLVAGYLTAGVAERFRPRHRTAPQQLAHGAVLLSARGFASPHGRI